MSHRVIDDTLDIDESLNWADYVDALQRQGQPKRVLVSETIRGRRLRDRYLDQVTIFKLVQPHSRSG